MGTNSAPEITIPTDDFEGQSHPYDGDSDGIPVTGMDSDEWINDRPVTPIHIRESIAVVVRSIDFF